MKITIIIRKFHKILWINVIYIVLLNDCSAQEFGYSKQEQLEWPKHYPQCGGNLQSPIPISRSKARLSALPPLRMTGYKKRLPGPVTVTNNGHTVSFTLPTSGTVPTIEGAALKGKYELQSFHFHWGSDNNRGSEHTLNGKRFPLELHLVHINSKYNRNLDEALNHADGLSVIGIFYEYIRSGNKALEPIVRTFPNVVNAGQKYRLSSPSFSLRSLFPDIIASTYYDYKGSLTTPPCSEVVNWIIFPKLLPKVTATQLKAFRSLKEEDGSPLVNNYRFLQPINSRPIYLHKGK